MTKAQCTHCGRHWNGHAECHCAVCHRHFSDVQAFDGHHPASTDGRCVDPATLHRRDGNPRYVLGRGPLGDIWTRWDPRPHPWAGIRPTERTAYLRLIIEDTA